MTSPTPLSLWCVVAIEGAQATQFLQGQLTANVHQVTDTIAVPFCHCNNKGRVITLGWVAKWQGDWVLLMPKAHHDAWQNTIALVAKLSRITPHLLEHVQVWGLQTKMPTHKACPLGTKDALLLSLFAHSNMQLMLSDPASPPSLPHADAMWLNDHDWPLQCIQQDIPWLGLDQMQTWTPQMLNAIELNMVDFKKGCFLGQEIIARTQHLGKRKRILCHFKSDHPIDVKPGDTIMQQGARIGDVLAHQNDQQHGWTQAVIQYDAYKNPHASWTVGPHMLACQPLSYTLIV